MDIKKYFGYSIYSAKSKLKSEIANSYLNWIWWVLEPLCDMLVYSFIFGTLLVKKQEHYAAFIFSGIIVWNFFNRTILASVKLVRNRKSIISRIYVPKFILLLSEMFVNMFKLLISEIILLVLLVVMQIPISAKILYSIPILCILFLFTFGCGMIIMHCGVFVDDLDYVMKILLKVLFYLSGIFYSISDRFEGVAQRLMLGLNPVAQLIVSMRNVAIYQSGPLFPNLIACFLLAIILSIVGIKLVYKYENSYVKVI